MKKTTHILTLVFITLILTTSVNAEDKLSNWVDSVYQQLTMPEKLGQTVWLELNSFPNDEMQSTIRQYVAKGRIGGVIFNEGDEWAIQKFIKQLERTAPYPVRFFCNYRGLTNPSIDTDAKLIEEDYLKGAPKDAITEYANTVAKLGLSQGFDGYILDEEYNANQLPKNKITSFISTLSQNGLKVISQNPALSSQSDASLLSNYQFDSGLKPKKLFKEYRNNETFEITSLKSEDLMMDWLNADVVILNQKELSSLEQLEHKIYNNKWYSRILSDKSKVALKWNGLKVHNRQKLKSFYEQETIEVSNFNLISSTIVVAKNDGSLPFKSLDESYAVLKRTPVSKVAQYASRYASTKEFYLPDYKDRLEQLLTELVNTKHLIVEYAADTWSKDLMRILQFLESEIDITFLVDETSQNIEAIETLGNIVWVKNNTNRNIDLTVQLLFGSLDARGQLPYDLTASVKSGSGYRFRANPVLKYSFPAYVKADEEILKNIDPIVDEAISGGAFPGCQIAVIKNNNVIYNKAFGYFTYDSIFRVSNNTIYDLASVTKVAATIQAVMFLTEQDMINLDDTVGFYLPETIGSNKSNIPIRKLLLHEAGLKSYLPFWKVTIEKDKLNSFTYQSTYDSIMGIKTYGLYFPTPREKGDVWEEIIASDLRKLKKGKSEYDYLYSDLGFMILQMIVERVTNQSMDEFLAQNVYDPLGLNTMTFNPLTRFGRNQIAPTEYDYYFRNAQIWGTVHDQNSQVLGGVAGHAGLFSNALDLAKLMQMNLNGGIYGNHKYIHDKTLNAFTAKQHNFNRRGLGWDKPDPIVGHVSSYASPDTYGHSGFTGTSVWVDPKKDLIFVFLSNRVFPNVSNRKLMKDNIRTRIQNVIYKAIDSDI